MYTIIMRDRRLPQQNRTVRTFEDCLDENSYEMLCYVMMLAVSTL